jgi:hypothetical protein
MRRFHLILLDDASCEPRRIDFHAESPDHAFQVARNETDGTHVELWDGDTLLARMTKSAANMWKLLPHRDPATAALSNISLHPQGSHAQASRVRAQPGPIQRVEGEAG